MSRRGKAATCRRSPNFSDKNWVQIGLKWVRFHFLKKSKLEKSSMFIWQFAFLDWVRLVIFTFDRITKFPRNQAAPLVGRESSRAVPPHCSEARILELGVGIKKRGLIWSDLVGFSRIHWVLVQFTTPSPQTGGRACPERSRGAGMTIRKAKRQERVKAPDSKLPAPPASRWSRWVMPPPSALNSKLSTINCLIITRDFNRDSGKENGTIPFYATFSGAGLTRISLIGTNSEATSQGRGVPSAKFQVQGMPRRRRETGNWK